MKFKNISEAFNFYREKTVTEIETRASEIKAAIDADENADIEAFNIELEGLKQAKQNHETRSKMKSTITNFFTKSESAQLETRAEVMQPDNVLASKEYRSAFYKMLLGRTLTQPEQAAFNLAATETRADAYGTSGTIGAVVPQATLDEIIVKARAQGGIFEQCRGFEIPANLTVPIATPQAKAAWGTEGAGVESNAPTIGAVTFGGIEIIKVLSISAKIGAVSVSALESYLVDELNATVMACLADGVVNGQGTTEGMGILSGVSWVTTPGVTQNAHAFTGDSNTTLSFSDITTTMGLLKKGYSRGAAWALNNKTLYTQVYGLLDGLGRPVFTQDPQSETIGKILGYPVVIDEYLADNVLLFGNFAYMGYNLANGIRIDVSKDSSFKTGRVDYRALAIADTKPLVTEAFAKTYKA